MNKEHPILFNAEMVKAILGGTKTMTRRVIVPQPPYHPNIQEPLFKKCILHGIKGKLEYWLDEHTGKTIYCPYGQVGDQLWVRETYLSNEWGTFYLADGSKELQECGVGAKWKPSRFMPRWASRITLEITEIRVERLQEITEPDIKAEGTEQGLTKIGYYYAFGQLWNSLNARRGYGWEVNPWVWVISFATGVNLK